MRGQKAVDIQKLQALLSCRITATKPVSACMPLTLLPFGEPVELPPKPPHLSHQAIRSWEFLPERLLVEV